MPVMALFGHSNSLGASIFLARSKENVKEQIKEISNFFLKEYGGLCYFKEQYNSAWEQYKMASLEDEFHKEMLAIYDKARDELGIRLPRFKQMVERNGGVEAAKKLLHSNSVSTGFSKLFERGRLDLTVESLVANNEKWHPLFKQEEIRKAKAIFRQ